MTSLRKAAGCVVALTMFLAGCASDLPQARHSYSGAVDASEMAKLEARGNGLSAEQRERLRKAREAQLRKELGFAELVNEMATPIAGMGFVDGRTMGYLITRDGSGGVFAAGKAPVALQQIAERIDKTLVAGAPARRIIGISANGTMMSWNPDNLSQQVVLRPQKSTFGRVHVFDAEPLRGSNALAMVTEGGGMEIWSLVSGNPLRQAKLKDTQPRIIAQDSVMGSVVFGTNSGEVRLWAGGSRSTLLYHHGGPVLAALVHQRRGLVISSAKDGSVQVWDRRTRQVRYTMQFPRAVYQLKLDPGDRWLVAVPATGNPRVLDLETGKERRLNLTEGRISADITFSGDGRMVAFQTGARAVTLWRLDLGVQSGSYVPKFGKGVADYALTSQGVLVLASNDGRVEYWDTRRRIYLTTALRAADGVSHVAASPDGRRVMVATAAGKTVGFDLNTEQDTPLRIEASDAQD